MSPPGPVTQAASLWTRFVDLPPVIDGLSLSFLPSAGLNGGDSSSGGARGSAPLSLSDVHSLIRAIMLLIPATIVTLQGVGGADSPQAFLGSTDGTERRSALPSPSSLSVNPASSRPWLPSFSSPFQIRLGSSPSAALKGRSRSRSSQRDPLIRGDAPLSPYEVRWRLPTSPQPSTVTASEASLSSSFPTSSSPVSPDDAPPECSPPVSLSQSQLQSLLSVLDTASSQLPQLLPPAISPLPATLGSPGSPHQLAPTIADHHLSEGGPKDGVMSRSTPPSPSGGGLAAAAASSYPPRGVAGLLSTASRLAGWALRLAAGAGILAVPLVGSGLVNLRGIGGMSVGDADGPLRKGEPQADVAAPVTQR